MAWWGTYRENFRTRQDGIEACLAQLHLLTDTMQHDLYHLRDQQERARRQLARQTRALSQLRAALVEERLGLGRGGAPRVLHGGEE